MTAMAKRIAAALLWFYVGWYAWAFLATVTPVSSMWGPVFGAAIAALVTIDPLHWFWRRTSRVHPPTPIAQSEPSPS